MVSVLTFYFDDPSSNLAEIYHFPVKLYLKRTKVNKKRPRLAHLKKDFYIFVLCVDVANVDEEDDHDDRGADGQLHVLERGHVAVINQGYIKRRFGIYWGS